MNQHHGMMPTVEAQVGRLEQFHEMLDHGLDVFNPRDNPNNVYITDQSETARALAASACSRGESNRSMRIASASNSAR